MKIAKVINQASDPYVIYGSMPEYKDLWKWGGDNLFPSALARLNRRSNNHRGIIQSKIRYVAGQQMRSDNQRVQDFIDTSNANGDTLHEIFKRILTDKYFSGNNFIELVTNQRRSFLNIYPRDFTLCRLGRSDEVVLYHKWNEYKKNDAKRVPLYPVWDKGDDGCLHSFLHLKQYEPGFTHYGLPDWIGGMMPGAIAYKTDKWNISRLDNSFNSSGVLVVDGVFESKTDERKFINSVKEFFTGEGNAGKVFTVIKDPGKGEGKGTVFTPVNQQTEGDWKELHTLTTDDLIIAHGWYRALSGITDSTGFDTKRILNEYEVALSVKIHPEQTWFKEQMFDILSEFLKTDVEIDFVNRPPAMVKQPYMRIWEARKADGLEYDESDPGQQLFLAQIGKGVESA